MLAFFLVYPLLIVSSAVLAVVVWYRTRPVDGDEQSLASFERQRAALRGGQR